MLDAVEYPLSKSSLSELGGSSVTSRCPFCETFLPTSLLTTAFPPQPNGTNVDSLVSLVVHGAWYSGKHTVRDTNSKHWFATCRKPCLKLIALLLFLMFFFSAVTLRLN